MTDIAIVVRGQDRSDAMFTSVRRGYQRMGEQADRTASESRRSMRQLETGVNQAADAMDEAATSAGNMAAGVQEAGGEAGGLGDILGGVGGRAGALGEKLSGLGPVGVAAAATLGAAMMAVGATIAAVTAAVNASMERTNALARSKAQLGLSPADAAKFGKMAAEIYADNFGATLEDAGKAARDTAMFITDMTDPQFKALAEKLSSVSDMMEAETKEVARSVAQLVRTGMVKNAEEGFDLIVAAVNKGVDANDDLLDTLNEYSTQFRKVGIDGKTAMGLISQAMKAGARDSDVAADAIKEFSIRSIDGSKAAADAYKALGLDAKKMIKTFAAGGPEADKAFSLVIERLKAIKDPADQAAAAVGLFGPKAEDLGAALLAMDLGKAKKEFEDVAGAADKAVLTMSGSGFNAMEEYRRQWEMLKADLGDKLLPTFERIVEVISRVIEALKPMAMAGLQEIAKLWNDNKASIEEFWQIAEPILTVLGALIIGTIVFALGLVIKWISAVGEAWSDLKSVFLSASGPLLSFFSQMLDGAVRAFGWIPGIGPKLKAAQKEFEDFRSKVNLSLDQITKQVYIDIHYRSIGGISLPQAQGSTIKSGNIKAQAAGGYSSGIIMAGEYGRELIDVGTSARTYNAGETKNILAGASGGGGPLQVVVEAGPGLSRELGDAIVRNLSFRAQRAGGLESLLAGTR